MYIVLSYDIASKKLSKVKKTCDMYLMHIQKSVYEGEITEKNLARLKSALFGMINAETDSIIIYKFEAPDYVSRDSIGAITDVDCSYI